MTANIDHLNPLQKMRLAWALMQDERVSPWFKRIGPAVILAYVLSPIDIIPDFILGPGQVDDLGVVAFGVFLLARLLVTVAPAEVVREHLNGISGRRQASPTPASQEDETIETRGRVRR